MGKVGKAIAGVAASALIGGGAYGLEIVANNAERSAVSRCVDDFEGEAREKCIKDVESAYSAGDALGILELAGVVGIIGCGYLGYKAVKEEIGTTGIIDDHL